MARDVGRSFAPIIPRDANDPARFGQMVETTKDAFAEAIRTFFLHAQVTGERRAEIPIIEKYAITAAPNDPHTTVVSIYERHPEVFERLPMILVMSAQGSQRPLTVGPPIIAHVQSQPKIRFPLAQPYSLVEGDQLAIRTRYDHGEAAVSTFVFNPSRFSTAMNVANAADLAAEINAQAVDVRAHIVQVGGNTYVEIEVIASAQNPVPRAPIEIEVHPETSANFLTASGLGRRGTISQIVRAGPITQAILPANSLTANDVGRYLCVQGADLPHFNDGRFSISAASINTGGIDTITYANRFARSETPISATYFVGLRDSTQNSANPVKVRYGYAFDLDVTMATITNDEVTRKELSDLMTSFLAFFMQDRFFTLLGRSIFRGQTVSGEHYQIVFNEPARHAGENEVPRPTDLNDRVYVASHSIRCAVSWYIDREFYYPGTFTSFQGDLVSINASETLVLPSFTQE